MRCYIDPGAASVALQLLFAGVLAAAALCRVYWQRIVEWARRVWRWCRDK
jgi:hypothetical protein